MRDMQDGSMQPSILYNGFLGQVWGWTLLMWDFFTRPNDAGRSGDDYQPLNLDLATQEWLTAGGVRRVCAGHLSLGYTIIPEMFKPFIV